MQHMQITPEQAEALEKAVKLLEMAKRKEGNEAEAEVAMRKYQDLLLRFNLDQAVVEQASGKQSGKREEQKLGGGMYEYQRNLWAWAAELNFCLYWTTREGYWYNKGGRSEGFSRRTWALGWVHRLVGRSVNVAATIALAKYLEQAIERVTMEAVGNQNSQRFTRYAMSIRRGMSDRLCEKMATRRREILDRETAERVEAEQRAREAERDGVSTSTAITVAGLRESERNANMDFLYGDGWSAKRAQEMAAAAERRRREEEEYRQWAAANPQEARKRAQAEEEASRKRMAKRRTEPKKLNVDLGAYYRGRDLAEDVGLDQQVDAQRRPALGGGK